MSHYYCVRCNNPNVIIYDNSFKCNECGLNFNKKDFNTINDKSNILSIEEQLGVAQVLKKYSKGDLFKQLDTQDTLKKI